MHARTLGNAKRYAKGMRRTMCSSSMHGSRPSRSVSAASRTSASASESAAIAAAAWACTAAAEVCRLRASTSSASLRTCDDADTMRRLDAMMR